MSDAPRSASPEPASTPRPLPLPPANLSLGTWPGRRARITPDAAALQQGSRSLTYAQLDERVRRAARVLVEAGVGKGDRVAYLGPNDLATFEVFFAAGLVGAVAVHLNTRLAAPEIAYMLVDCDPTVLVYSRTLAPLVPAAGQWPASLRLLLVLERPDEGDDTPDPAHGLYDSWLETAKPLSLGELGYPVGLDDPALILYTSGTTGRPKGAVLTHGNLTFNTMNQLAHFDSLSADRGLCFSPLFHVVGLGQVTLPTLFKSGSVEVMARFDAGAVLVELDEIASAAVVGAADERWGEVGWAFVELRPGSTLTEDGVRRHLTERLARYKVPTYVSFVDALPRNATGKILRAKLREALFSPRRP